MLLVGDQLVTEDFLIILHVSPRLFDTDLKGHIV